MMIREKTDALTLPGFTYLATIRAGDVAMDASFYPGVLGVFGRLPLLLLDFMVLALGTSSISGRRPSLPPPLLLPYLSLPFPLPVL